MGSRRETGVERVRPRKRSRRVNPAEPVSPPEAPGQGEAADAVPAQAGAGWARWLTLDGEIERLQTRWAKLEDWLATRHAWFRLSAEERKATPWDSELRRIDARLDALVAQRNALLKALPVTGDADMESIITRLAVAERLIWPDDHPDAHALIKGSRQDLMRLAERDRAATSDEGPSVPETPSET